MKFSNKKLIFEIVAAVGVVATGVTAAIGMKKAKEKIDIKEQEEGGELSNASKIACSWHYFVPAGVIAGSVILCNRFNDKDSIDYTGELLTAISILKEGHSAFINATRKLYGDEAVTAIQQEILMADDVDVYTPCVFSDDKYNTIDGLEDEPLRTFYDTWARQYFESTYPAVLIAQNNLSRNYVLRGYADWDEFRDFLGLPRLGKEGHGDYGWDVSGGLAVLDFKNTRMTLSDGMEVISIEPLFSPDILDEE